MSDDETVVELTDSTIDRALRHADDHRESAEVIAALVALVQGWRGMATCLLGRLTGSDRPR